MTFEIDKQTIADLELFDNNRTEKSLFSYFNYTKSVGGKELLEKIYSSPTTDQDVLEERIEAVRFFSEARNPVRIDREMLDFIEFYLTRPSYTGPFRNLNAIFSTVKNFVTPNNDYYVLTKGTRDVIAFINDLYFYALYQEDEKREPESVKKIKRQIIEIVEGSFLKRAIDLKDRKTLKPYEYASVSFIFRKREARKLREALNLIYGIDVLTSLASALKKHHFSLPSFTGNPNTVTARGIFHPFLMNPVENDIEFGNGKKLCFITGPNMAGKSTFLKSLGVCIYLSHIGFPLPARQFQTSVFQGLSTTINLPDNLSKGYSHFYNEVLRVRYVAEQIKRNGNMFVVFDELFRGTNIKDAFEASLSVIKEFSRLSKSTFAVSTHIVEIADEIRDLTSVFFRFFEANIIDDTPRYNYVAKEGVTDERIGLYILEKERVLEIIRSADT
jgi:DNA mismatch repair ATPase MutS